MELDEWIAHHVLGGHAFEGRRLEDAIAELDGAEPRGREGIERHAESVPQLAASACPGSASLATVAGIASREEPRMSDAAPAPSFTFKTRTNTELGADSLRVDDDGSVVLEGIVKKVTESMLTSYPRTLLGKWTPNRAALRFSADEIGDRQIPPIGGGGALDLAGIRSAASSAGRTQRNS